jgi:hypothetical protein
MHNLNLNLPFGNKATPKHKLKKNITKYKCPVASSHCSECKKEIGKATIMATLILEKKKTKNFQYYSYVIGSHCISHFEI